MIGSLEEYARSKEMNTYVVITFGLRDFDPSKPLNNRSCLCYEGMTFIAYLDHATTNLAGYHQSNGESMVRL